MFPKPMIFENKCIPQMRDNRGKLPVVCENFQGFIAVLYYKELDFAKHTIDFLLQKCSSSKAPPPPLSHASIPGSAQRHQLQPNHNGLRKKDLNHSPEAVSHPSDPLACPSTNSYTASIPVVSAFASEENGQRPPTVRELSKIHPRSTAVRPQHRSIPELQQVRRSAEPVRSSVHSQVQQKSQITPQAGSTAVHPDTIGSRQCTPPPAQSSQDGEPLSLFSQSMKVFKDRSLRRAAKRKRPLSSTLDAVAHCMVTS